MNQSPVNWFDVLVIITILLGIRAGRKNGMSVELMPTLQWITIVIAGAFLYQPLGNYLADVSPMSHLACYIIVYLLIAAAVKGFYMMLKKSAGGKLAGSDVFGRYEFYLGMGAATVRYVCVLLAAMALMNAPKYTAQQIAANRAVQLKNYDHEFFPGFGEIQLQVFKESFIGGLLKKNAEFLFIAPTQSEPDKGLQRRKDY